LTISWDIHIGIGLSREMQIRDELLWKTMDAADTESSGHMKLNKFCYKTGKFVPVQCRSLETSASIDQ
jgi:hypothetical protein